MRALTGPAIRDRAMKPTCSAARGRKIGDKVVLRLVAAAGGWCERPGCPTGSLWHELPDGTAVKLAEVAHIVAASDDGPRGDDTVPTEDLVGFDNLILLCPNCHTIVDRAPKEHPVELLRRWKTDHENRLREILGVPVAATRAEARTELVRLLAQNHAVFEQYGPGSAASAHPESADTWLREVRAVILPNNARISVLLEVNAALLRPEEHKVVAAFETHRRGLEARHLGIDMGVAAPRFPTGLETVYADADADADADAENGAE